jgi:hypothetical protein
MTMHQKVDVLIFLYMPKKGKFEKKKEKSKFEYSFVFSCLHFSYFLL